MAERCTEKPGFRWRIKGKAVTTRRTLLQNKRAHKYAKYGIFIKKQVMIHRMPSQPFRAVLKK